MWLVELNNKTWEIEEQICFDKRFENDKVFNKEKDGIIILDGVLLNKYNLLQETREKNICNYIRSMHIYSKTFFEKFKGPFSGCYVDNEKCEIIAFGNQTGDTTIFYYIGLDFSVVSSDFNMIFDWCKRKKIQLTFNEVAANHILSLGYITEGNTIANEIKRLSAGEYIQINNDIFEIHRYHKFEFGKYNDWSLDKTIDEVDKTFRKAVELCFNKDLEYGYTSHLVDLSGGLDSRMTNVVAKSLGFGNITNICYAQENSRDAEYAKCVADFLNNNFEFESLDNTSFLFDIEKLVKMNFGSAVYFGITGGERLLSHIDFNKFGLEHTGQLGDVVVGYKKISTNFSGELNTNQISYSTIVKPTLALKSNYKNQEEFAFYYRFFNGTLSTHYIRRNYTEAVSPFIDPDFLQLCMHINPNMRENHKLYWEWIRKCYPEIYKIPSTRNHGGFRMKVYHWLPPIIGRFIIKICKKIGLVSLVSDKRGMNPVDIWFAKSRDLTKFVEDYYNDHIHQLDCYTEILNSVEKVYLGERADNKLIAITVLAIYDLYFNKCGRKDEK